MSVFGNEMAHTPFKKIKIMNDILTNRYYMLKVSRLTPTVYSENGEDLMSQSTSSATWVSGGDMANLWYGRHIWTINFESVNTSFDSSTDPIFLEHIYKIENTFSNEMPATDNDLGDTIKWQGGSSDWASNSLVDTTTDNDNRFIQVVDVPGYHPSNILYVNIFAYINGALHYLEGTNRLASGFYPTSIDPTQPYAVNSTPLWFPVDANNLMNDPNSNSVWIIETET